MVVFRWLLEWASVERFRRLAQSRFSGTSTSVGGSCVASRGRDPIGGGVISGGRRCTCRWLRVAVHYGYR